jgi:DNA-binding transcriptional LysR family regulator
VLVHPPDWGLDDPFDVAGLSDLALLSPESGDVRYDRLVDNLRAAGIEPNITAQTNDRALLVQLVRQGVGAWLTYGRRAREAAAGGAAGMVHLRPRPMREIGVVHLGDLRGAAADFVEALHKEAIDVLIPPDDAPGDDSAWLSGADVHTSVPPSPQRTTSPR